MCRQVLTSTGTLGCLADLRAAGLTVPKDTHEPDQADNWCLCGVDVAAVLDANRVPYGRDFLGDFVVTTLRKVTP